MQVRGELSNVLVRKADRSRTDARSALRGCHGAFAPMPTTPEVMLASADLTSLHEFGIWDGVILDAAAHGGCLLLLSEDLQEGFT